MKNNIVLIGMPGAGKSTVGVVLAKVIGYEFLDLDLVIQKQQGKTLHEIISDSGVEGFTAVENAVCCSISPEKTVIATGGSAVYGKEGMEHLKDIGCVVYLKQEYPEIKKRLGNLEKRGVVLKKGQTLRDLFDERTPLYEKYADITIDEKEYTITRTVQRIQNSLAKFDPENYGYKI